MNARLLAGLSVALMPLPSSAHCWEEAAQTFGHDPRLLAAMAVVESRLRPSIVSRPNRNGTWDIGIMQINSGELPGLAKRGISEKDLLEPCRNIREGARILREKIGRVGATWRAVGAYNAGEGGAPSRQAHYVRQVKDAYTRLLDQPLPAPTASGRPRARPPAAVDVPPRRGESAGRETTGEARREPAAVELVTVPPGPVPAADVPPAPSRREPEDPFVFHF